MLFNSEAMRNHILVSYSIREYKLLKFETNLNYHNLKSIRKNIFLKSNFYILEEDGAHVWQ